MGIKRRLIVSFLTFALLFQYFSYLAASKPVFAAPPANFTNETLIAGLNEPTAIEFLPDGRMLVINRYGSIRIAQAGSTVLDATPVLTITNINTDQGERGLVGIAKDPNFSANGYIYVFYTAGSPLRDRVSRFTMTGDTASLASEFVVWEDNVAAELWHH